MPPPLEVLHWLGHFVLLLVVIMLSVERLQRNAVPNKPTSNAAAQPDIFTAKSRRQLLSMKSKALVTGITGMIGSAVAKVLCQQQEYEVHGLVRWRSNVRNLKGVLQQIVLHYGDMMDPHFMLKLIEDVWPAVIFHFAAQAYNVVSWDSPAYTLAANIFGTLNILEPLRKFKMNTTKLVAAGSSTEYGHTSRSWRGPIPETAPLIPVTPYGVSKVTTEMLCRQYYLNYGIPSIVARLFLHVGTGHTENQALQNFCLQVAEIEAGLRPPVLKVGSLNAQRDVTDVHDSAPVLVQLAALGQAGEAYNIASGKAVSMQHLVQLVLSLSKVKNIKVETEASRFRVYDEPVLLGDNAKVRNLTGWVPNPNIRLTVLGILNYWREEMLVRHNISRVSKPSAKHHLLGIATAAH
eukprot:GGOE01005658.1.p1 GENE.GGOE01005658.1~~GGOE01005658.1.p1  ORF type:complete len:438 (-),score=81.98 GGOE01005658.1:218-1438(-)